MRTNKKKFPQEYNADEKVLVCIPTALIPIITGKLAELEFASEWVTEQDWKQGYAAIVEVEACFMACGQTIVERLDKIIEGLGYKAALPNDDPLYDPLDTLRSQTEEKLEAIRTILSQIEALL